MMDTVPQHIAIIMDGNGRWAKEKGKSRTYGHRKGVESVRKIISHAHKREIKYLTLFTFSTENWHRPKSEVNILMKMFSKLLQNEVPELYKNNVRVRFSGRTGKISKELLDKMKHAEDYTSKNTGLNLILAIDYGGRQEIIDTIKKMHREKKNFDRLDEAEFSRHLYQPDVPDPDLLIRTANEMRISNFLLWEMAYTEFYITDVLWPEFDEKEFDKAVNEFCKRDRKFGKIKK